MASGEKGFLELVAAQARGSVLADMKTDWKQDVTNPRI